MNTEAVGRLFNALVELQGVEDTELIQAALKHKIQALSVDRPKEGLSGTELIDAMSDEELAIAMLENDKRIGLGRHPNPFFVSYLKKRTRAPSL